MTKYVVEVTVTTDREVQKPDVDTWVEAALKAAHQAIIVPESQGEGAIITRTNVRGVDKE